MKKYVFIYFQQIYVNNWDIQLETNTNIMKQFN